METWPPDPAWRTRADAELRELYSEPEAAVLGARLDELLERSSLVDALRHAIGRATVCLGDGAPEEAGQWLASSMTLPHG
ncbi:MAG: hypothetical protein JWR63_2021 [Conexibacter sp.]|nr:hypothetical protein [Conexibacter sp.]